MYNLMLNISLSSSTMYNVTIIWLFNADLINTLKRCSVLQYT